MILKIIVKMGVKNKYKQNKNYNIWYKYAICHLRFMEMLCYKYLGVMFSPNGKFNKARAHLITQARKAMHLLYKQINNLCVSLDLQLKLFDNTIVPLLLFFMQNMGNKKYSRHRKST
jgi:hypothetical protein